MITIVSRLCLPCVTIGTGQYDVLVGATSPTLSAPLNGVNQIGSLTNADFSVNFTTATLTSVVLAGTFPDGTWALGGGPVPLVGGSAALTGNATLPTACGGVCGTVSGNTNFGFAGADTDGIVFSYFGATNGSEASWAGVGVVTFSTKTP